jgi:hypothetical protein
MTVTVSCEEIAALLGWYLTLRAQKGVLEVFRFVAKLHTNSAPQGRLQSPPTASPPVSLATDVLA